MAVVLQKLVGRRHESYFYPDLAGVACCYNYYPVLGTSPEDGVALVALGLGKTVVDGERAVRFSPGRPRSMPQFSSTADYLENAQRDFYALDLGRRIGHIHADADEAIVHLDLETAEAHGTLGAVASTYSADNDAVYDGISRQGIRLVTLRANPEDRSVPVAPDPGAPAGAWKPSWSVAPSRSSSLRTSLRTTGGAAGIRLPPDSSDGDRSRGREHG